MALITSRRAPEAHAATGSDAAVPTRETGQRFGSLSSVCGAIFVLIAGIIGSSELHDNSFLTHLATGRWITSGHFGELWMGNRDPYLFTSGGRTWVVQSWLASVLYDGAERFAGAAGVRLLVAAMCMALAAALWRLSAPSRTLIGRVAAVGGALAVGGTVWSERPLMFGLVFLALSLLAADGAIRAAWLVPIGWLWVNVHGSFPLGVVAIAAIAAGTLLDRAPAQRELRALRNLVVGCVLGGLVSPVGPVLLTFPLALLGRHDVLAHVQEWKPTDLSETWAQVFVGVVAVAALGVARQRSFRSALPLAVFTVAGFFAARNVVVASVVLVPIVARGLDGLGSIADRRSGATRVAAWTLVALTPLLVASSVVAGDYRFDAYPVSAVDWLDQRNLLDGSVRVAEEDFTGNYLEWRYGGQVKAFIDDRYDLHDRALVDDYLTLHDATVGWRDVLDRHGIDVVLWSRAEPLRAELEASGEWRLAFDSTVDGVDVDASRLDGLPEYVVYCRSSVTRCFADSTP